MKVLYALVIAATAIACTSIRPVAVQLGDRCLRCSRSIGDVRLAGEIIDGMRAPFPFRTAGCMARYVKAHPDRALTAIFVTDHRTGGMLPAASAWFVPTQLTSADGRTVEADYLAFRSRTDAEQARTGQEPLLRWAQVFADARTD